MLLDEPCVSEQFAETFKLLTAGEPCDTDVKNKSHITIFKTPIIICSNNPISKYMRPGYQPSFEEAMSVRRLHIRTREFNEAKHMSGDIHPCAWLAIMREFLLGEQQSPKQPGDIDYPVGIPETRDDGLFNSGQERSPARDVTGCFEQGQEAMVIVSPESPGEPHQFPSVFDFEPTDGHRQLGTQELGRNLIEQGLLSQRREDLAWIPESDLDEYLRQQNGSQAEDDEGFDISVFDLEGGDQHPVFGAVSQRSVRGYQSE